MADRRKRTAGLPPLIRAGAFLVSAICTVGVVACGGGSDEATTPEKKFEWAEGSASPEGLALATELYSPRTLSHRTAVTDGIMELTRQCMADAGFSYEAFSVSETGGIYSPLPHPWEVEKLIETDSGLGSDPADPLDAYLASLSAADQAKFDKAMDSGGFIDVEALGTRLQMRSKGCRAEATKNIVGDLAQYIRLDHIAGNLNAQAEQYVLGDPEFTKASEAFEACADSAGIRAAIYPIDVLQLSNGLAEGTKEAAVRCSAETNYEVEGSTAFEKAQGRFAAYYESDLRQYLTLLPAAAEKANLALTGS